MLSEPAVNALQDCYDNPLMVVSDLASVLVREMLRLYPPGWNDPVTPERLVELGGVELRHDGPPQLRVVNFASGASVDFYNGDVDSVDIGSQTEFVMLHSCMFPRNMQEARELLERCGAIKEEV